MNFMSEIYFTSPFSRVIDDSIKNFKAFFRWLYVGKINVFFQQRDSRMFSIIYNAYHVHLL